MSNYEQKFICPKTKTALVLAEDGNTLHNTSTEEPISYEINDIVDLTYPKELFEQDRKEQLAYNDAYQRYDRGVTWVFESLNSDEATVRQKMTNLLGLKPGMKVLEVGAGTGKDSELIIKAIAPGGQAFLSDLSPNMLRLAKQRLQPEDVDVNYFIANGTYLPFEDNTFDAVFHFGGINTFSERKEAFEEFNRVVKVGGRVVVGDESVAPWLRDQSSYQTLMSANPMFADQVPLEDLPKNIDNFELHWIFGFGYYVLAFEKTDKTPEVNVNLQIPGKDFEDNWRIRAERNAQKKA
ncbi:class I SAM-dependent methyltransferase [Flectobacillus longus]|jgi:ubiquinone/menaquinone biosynthesis C-methylase UbiE|uniref:Class I SAM-dependent methyltransferase n=1 Tax=Flectobacillus longus TaxID=2984207 RepID=A0ABT6YKC6_9BACT|nr:class I SAM-dependent methyltransferase [Flectobacillus longus]MDI9864030.1 class I SAM-dependent methyltransferase [Flectobacillus longus]MDI9879181.1 class I SAM-dependent methyltransferase [Flectobacillus longus]